MTPVVVLFAIRALWDDPLRPWWSAGPALWLSLCVLMLAAVTASQRRAFLSLGFAVLGSVMIGLRPWLGLGQSPAPVRQDVLDLIHITLIGSALHALVWSVVTIVHERRRPTDDLPLLFPLSHHVVALIGTIVAALPALAVVSQRITDMPSLAALDVTPATALGWTALGPVGRTVCPFVWGAHGPARASLALRAGLGSSRDLVDSFRAVAQTNSLSRRLCSLAGYVVVTGAAWSARRPLRAAALRWGAAAGDVNEEGTLAWLSAANAALCLVVILSGFWIVLNYPESQLRIAAALATLALAPGVALLATKPRERLIQMDALIVGSDCRRADRLGLDGRRTGAARGAAADDSPLGEPGGDGVRLRRAPRSARAAWRELVCLDSPGRGDRRRRGGRCARLDSAVRVPGVRSGEGTFAERV